MERSESADYWLERSDHGTKWPVTVMHLADYRSMNKLKSLLQKTRKVTLFVWKSIRKNAPLSSEIHCYVKNRKGFTLLKTGTEVTVPQANSPNWSLYISLKNKLREFDKRSKHFLFGDHLINSHNLISWHCMDITWRKLILVTIGT